LFGESRRHTRFNRALAQQMSTEGMDGPGEESLEQGQLRGGDAAKLIDLAELTPVVNSLRGHYTSDAHVQELITMFEQLRRRSGK